MTHRSAHADDGVTAEDEEYARHDGRPLLLRLYRPVEVAHPLPVVVSVHGGVWTAGDRKSDEAVNRRIAQSGIIVAAPEFRQPPDAAYPTSLIDISMSIRWLRANAPDLGGRAGAIGGLGFSSGAHQLLLLGLRPKDVEVPDIVPVSIPYLVAYYPIVDPLARHEWATGNEKPSLVERSIRYWGSEEAMWRGSPQRIIDDGQASALPSLMLLHGDSDQNMPVWLAQRFVRSYTRAGGDAALLCFSRTGHRFAKQDSSAAREAIALTASFIGGHHVRGADVTVARFLRERPLRGAEIFSV